MEEYTEVAAFNFDGIDDTTATQSVPAGRYPVAITKAEWRAGKDSGIPYMNFQTKVVSDDETVNDSTLFAMVSLSSKNFARKQAWIAFRSLGFTPDQIKSAKWTPTDSPDLSDFLGRTGTVEVSYKAGEDRPNVKFVLVSDPRSPSPAAPSGRASEASVEAL